ncbi:MAG: hypothetical protein Q8Q06_00465 [bacterium]|nr:hypothetical protein [bacterium]
MIYKDGIPQIVDDAVFFTRPLYYPYAEGETCKFQILNEKDELKECGNPLSRQNPFFICNSCQTKIEDAIEWNRLAAKYKRNKIKKTASSVRRAGFELASLERSEFGQDSRSEE